LPLSSEVLLRYVHLMDPEYMMLFPFPTPPIYGRFCLSFHPTFVPPTPVPPRPSRYRLALPTRLPPRPPFSCGIIRLMVCFIFPLNSPHTPTPESDSIFANFNEADPTFLHRTHSAASARSKFQNAVFAVSHFFSKQFWFSLGYGIAFSPYSSPRCGVSFWGITAALQ